MTDGNSTAVSLQSEGANHFELDGGQETYRFRGARLEASRLAAPPICLVDSEDDSRSSARVVDLSPRGVAIVPDDPSRFEPGVALPRIRLDLRGEAIWEGPAVVAYRVNGDLNRVGLRFSQGRLDLQRIDLRDRVDRRLARHLAGYRDQVELLSPSWRAGVAELRVLLGSARRLMEEIEEEVGRESLRRDADLTREICDQVFDSVWPTYQAQLEGMEAASRGLSEEDRAIGRRYASRELMPLLRPCPIHRRAFEKPRGYAGDYRLMQLIDDAELSGETLYGCFLQRVVQRFELGRAVVARGDTARRKVAEIVESTDGPCRILSLASGPALELRRFLATQPPLSHPLELILLDQDEEALEEAHAGLDAAIEGRPDADRIELTCLHFSVRQLLVPSNREETRLVDTLRGVDLIYSMGLFDYLSDGVAVRLLRTLHALLSEGGELFVGNLSRVSDCSWMMDYAVHWQLIYRREESMHRLGERVRVATETVRITRDATGRCLFLGLDRSA